MKDNELTTRYSKVEKYYNVNPNSLHRLTGKAPNTFMRIRKGDTKDPGVSTFAAICKAFKDLNPLWLFLGEGEMIISHKYPQNNADASHVMESHQCSECYKNESLLREYKEINRDLMMKLEEQGEQVGRLKQIIENYRNK
jgi:hypothetical protein